MKSKEPKQPTATIRECIAAVDYWYSVTKEELAQADNETDIVGYEHEAEVIEAIGECIDHMVPMFTVGPKLKCPNCGTLHIDHYFFVGPGFYCSTCGANLRVPEGSFKNEKPTKKVASASRRKP